MATTKQTQAARRNVKKAQRAATKKRTIAHLPKTTRRALQTEARKGARRGGQAGARPRGAQPAAAVRGGAQEGHLRPLKDGQEPADRGDPPSRLAQDQSAVGY